MQISTACNFTDTHINVLHYSKWFNYFASRHLYSELIPWRKHGTNGRLHLKFYNEWNFAFCEYSHEFPCTLSAFIMTSSRELYHAQAKDVLIGSYFLDTHTMQQQPPQQKTLAHCHPSFDTTSMDISVASECLQNDGHSVSWVYPVMTVNRITRVVSQNATRSAGSTVIICVSYVACLRISLT